VASNKVTYNPGIPRREDAYNRSAKKSMTYRFTEDETDAFILVGEFQGKKVSEIWQLGPEERDLIYAKLYKTDPKMKAIIDKLCCQ